MMKPYSEPESSVGETRERGLSGSAGRSHSSEEPESVMPKPATSSTTSPSSDEDRNTASCVSTGSKRARLSRRSTRQRIKPSSAGQPAAGSNRRMSGPQPGRSKPRSIREPQPEGACIAYAYPGLITGFTSDRPSTRRAAGPRHRVPQRPRNRPSSAGPPPGRRPAGRRC